MDLTHNFSVKVHAFHKQRPTTEILKFMYLEFMLVNSIRFHTWNRMEIMSGMVTCMELLGITLII